MSKAQRGLGRGLGALFPGADTQARPAGARTVIPIALADIAPNANQPRRAFDRAELDSLAQSMKTNGVLVPVLVRPKREGPAHYELIAGERRWRAAKLAGLRSIPALVRESQDGEAIELALLENLQRSDLNAIEEAVGYRQLIAEYDFTQERLAQRLGRSRPVVANALRLLSLPDSVQALVRDGKLSGGHARALATLSAPKAERLAREAVAKGWSVREIERAALHASGKAESVQHRAARALPPDLAEVETRLRFALATRVALRPAARGGTLEINYADDDELQRIVDRICPEE
ncbi:MAG: ParB/RepB/Spo0J family partition protein [Candidatus Eremiobacteraeota bacterium]|nr:ParB/RepB/Spo0J family partition protein [Candidatus Eremiobacteraeota bacterium]MBV8366189.1 ParB/RepB/Spo0J family partition protein [Candidatus Eremiobacteraeota bacterium]